MVDRPLSSTDASDACDALGIPAARTGALRPVWSPTPAVEGIVRTARLVPASGSSPLDDLLALFATGGPVVWLLDLGGRTDQQCFGGRLAAAAREAGVPGVLVNGAVRDVDELCSLRFPAFARGVFPAAMRDRVKLAAVDEPVAVDDAAVVGGDYVVADSSGLVAFAAARARDVRSAAEETR